MDSSGGTGKTASRGTPRQAGIMANTGSRVTIHMASSLDGFIARKDGRVDWLETSDEFARGDTMEPGFVEAVLKSIDCYVRSEEHTSELQSHSDLVCRLLLEKKKHESV